VLSVLEVAWRWGDEDLSEPFESDRHFIAARTWRELHDKMRWHWDSGRQQINQNVP